MNGFLRRLAAQSISSAPAPRAAILQPFTPAPTGAAGGTPLTHDTPPGESPHGHHETAASPGQIRDRSAPGEPAIAPARGAPSAGESAVRPAPAAPAFNLPHAQFAATPERDIARPPALNGMPRQTPEPANPALAHEAAFRPAVIETPAPPMPATGTRGSGTIRPAFPDSALPSPLLPLLVTPPPATPHAGAAAQSGNPDIRARQHRVEETTEVHVNIGRIEVTAVHEPAAPKRQAPAATRPMTLDEYLARRREA